MENSHTHALFERVSQEKKARIIDTAISEFAKHGFESANINHIASSAGVSVGAMYKYFTSKEELYLYIIHYCVEKLKTLLDDAIADETMLLKKIEKIIKAIQCHSRENSELNKIYNVMTTEIRSELVWKIVSDMEGVTAELYKSMIDQGKVEGVVREDADSRAFAYFLDNLFILLQFSYSCDYYKERMKLYVGVDVFENDTLVAEQLLKFIIGAFIK